MSSPATDEATRRRLIGVMFGANAFSSTAYISTITIASIVGATFTGSPRLAGVPSTISTVGTAIGAVVLAWAGARIGRRRSHATGFLAASVGVAGAAYAIATESFPLFLGSVFVLGFGRSISQLARFAAGDLRDESRRGAAISMVVWASTIGAVVGPALIGPSGDWVRSFGGSELLGPVLVGVVGFSIATVISFVGLRPDPLELAVADSDHEEDTAHPARISLGSILGKPSVQLAFATLVVAQLVMVFVMTMTPVHIANSGRGLDQVGWVMMAHTLGMFAIAPATGWLSDRYGPRRLIALGGVVLLVSCLGSSLATGAEIPILVAALFGLGVGWNFAFVSASALLQEGLSIAERVRIQGVADSTTWIASAVGSASSGVVLAATSYAGVSLIGASASAAILLAMVMLGRPVAEPV